MEEIKDKVIVLKSQNSKEKDKLVSLFSLTNGVIKANLKGVLKPDAKLKFMAQPFCFAEVNLIKKGEYYTIINAYPVETFFALTTNLDKFYLGSTVLEILNSFSLNESAYPLVFVSALKTLKFLEFQEDNLKVAIIKFMLEVFKCAGYGFVLNKCSECGAKILTEPYFDLDSGNIMCLSCKNQFCVKIEQQVLTNLKIVNNEEFENLKTIKIKDSVIDSILELLKKSYKSKFNYLIKTL